MFSTYLAISKYDFPQIHNSFTLFPYRKNLPVSRAGFTLSGRLLSFILHFKQFFIYFPDHSMHLHHVFCNNAYPEDPVEQVLPVG